MLVPVFIRSTLVSTRQCASRWDHAPDRVDGGIGLQIASRGAHHQDDRALRAMYELTIRICSLFFGCPCAVVEQSAGEVNQREVGHVR